MAEKPEDFKLPTSVVQKIIKDALPHNIDLDKDARDAIGRATCIFILYTTSCANNNAVNSKRRTLTAQDVIESINMLGFDEFITDLIKWHDGFRKDKARKEKQKARKQNLGEQSTSQFMGQSVDHFGCEEGFEPTEDFRNGVSYEGDTFMIEEYVD